MIICINQPFLHSYMKHQHHLLLLLGCLIAFSLSIFAFDGVRETIMKNTQIDSISHFIGFFFLTWLLNGVLKFPLMNVVIALCFYGALTEWGQLYLGFRNAEIKDYISDVLGVLSFAFLKWCKIYYQRDFGK